VERTHFLRELEPVDVGGQPTFVLVEPGYPDVMEARKHGRALEPGTYHLVTFIQNDIVVKPPELPEENTVDWGTVVQQRKQGKQTKGGKASKSSKSNGGGGAPVPAAA